MIDFLSSLYHTTLYEPVFNTLVVFYNIIPGQDFGIAVILVTLLFRVAFIPLSAKAVIAQRKLTLLQPQAKAIQEKFKKDKDRQAKELMALYKREHINPFAGIFPILIQLPILITLYRVFWRGLQEDQLVYLYGFVENPGVIDPSFLGVLNLGEQSLLVALLAGGFQFIQGKQMASSMPKSGEKTFAATFQKQAVYFFPVLTLLIVSQLPSAIGVYWIVTSLFTIGQQWYLKRKPD